MSSQARTSTDLWLISGGLVEACVKVDSARWNSCEFLAQRDQESRLKNFSQVFIYFVRIRVPAMVFSFNSYVFSWRGLTLLNNYLDWFMVRYGCCFSSSYAKIFSLQWLPQEFSEYFCTIYLDVKLSLDDRMTLSTT